MIISENKKPRLPVFEKVLNKAHENLKKVSEYNSKYFLKRTATEFEEDIYNFLCEASKNTPFENTIELISGYKFPDIVANKLYGVEVKTTKQNHWKSTGNSVLETTRVEDVSNIFIYFGKLSEPLAFRYKLYQDCLYDIAVTHSPRYLIDMELNEGETIFSKLGIDYNRLRTLPNPAKPFVEYYRKHTKPGEEPWWMDEHNTIVNPTIRIFSNLPKIEKDKLIIEAMAFFPEIFGRNQTKYQRVAGWLASRYGIVDSSLRDRFTAGGKVTIKVSNNSYVNVPRIFKNLNDSFSKVLKVIRSAEIDDLKYYWSKDDLRIYDKLIEIWLRLVLAYADESYPKGRKFLINLIGAHLKDKRPNFIKEDYNRYGLL